MNIFVVKLLDPRRDHFVGDNEQKPVFGKGQKFEDESIPLKARNVVCMLRSQVYFPQTLFQDASLQKLFLSQCVNGGFVSGSCFPHFHKDEAFILNDGEDALLLAFGRSQSFEDFPALVLLYDYLAGCKGFDIKGFKSV